MGKPNRTIRERRKRPNMVRLLDLNGSVNADRNLRSQNVLPAIPAEFSVSFLCRRNLAQNVRSFIAIGDSDNNQYTIRGGASGGTASFGITIRLASVNLLVQTNAVERKIENQDSGNQILHGVANFKPAENKVEFFLNGVLDWEFTDVLYVDGTVPPATSIYNIGTFFNLATINSSLASIGKLALFDRAHTPEEALASFLKGGEPAKSMYGNVISFIPFNEKYYAGSVAYGSVQEFNHFKPVIVTVLGTNDEGFGGWTDDDGGTVNANSVFLSLPDLTIVTRTSKLFFTRGASFVDINFLSIGDASITTKEIRVRRTSDNGLIKTVTVTAAGLNRVDVGSIHEPFYLEMFFDKTLTGTGNQIVQWNRHEIKTADFPVVLDLNNYLLDEAGETQPATQEKVISYDRDDAAVPANNWGLRFAAASNQGANNAALGNPINLGIYNNGVYLDFIVHEADGNIRFLVDGFDQANINNPAFTIRYSQSGSGYVIWLWLYTDFSNFHRATLNLPGGNVFELNKRYRLHVEYTSEDFSTAIVYVNGKEAVVIPQGVAGSSSLNPLIVNSLSICQNAPAGATFFGNATINDLAFTDGLITREERIELFKNGILPPGKLIERIRFEKRSDATVNSDVLINSLTLSNFTLANFNTYYKALPGAFSEPVQALDLTTERIELSGFGGIPAIREWTQTIVYKKDQDQFDPAGSRYFFAGGTFPTEYFYINSTGVPNQLQIRIQKSGVGLFSQIIEDVDVGKISSITVRQKVDNPASPTTRTIALFITGRKIFEVTGNIEGYDFTSQDPYLINAFPPDSFHQQMNLIQYSLNFRALTDDEILNAYAHQQLDGLPEDTEVVLNMNQGSFTENGVDVLILNEGIESAITIKALGFTGGTSALQLTDLLSKLVTVNSLKV